MRVSRTQAEQNRQTVIDVASRLFRENGFDGIGIKDLMKAAGLTQGAFYKQFASKEDLAAQASKRAFERISAQWSAAAESNPKDPLGAAVARYLSMGHREQRGAGCPLVALGTDAARQGADVKASFEAGIRKYLETLERWVGEAGGEDSTNRAMATFSTMVGALMLSRAVNDQRLAKHLLQAAAKSVMGSSAGPTREGQLR